MACILGYNNLIDGATVGGTGWDADYPVTNIQTQYQGHRARATGTSATITIALSGATAIGAVGVTGIISDTATIQVTGGAYDSGVITAHALAVLPAETAANWTIAINDPAAPAGFVAIGRVFMGPAFAPANNIDWDSSLMLESRIVQVESISGVVHFEPRRIRRVWRGKWSWLTAAEAYNGLYALQRQADVRGEVCLIEETDDPTHAAQRSFVGRFRTLSAVEWPYVNHYGMGVEIAEII